MFGWIVNWFRKQADKISELPPQQLPHAGYCGACGYPSGMCPVSCPNNPATTNKMWENAQEAADAIAEGKKKPKEKPKIRRSLTDDWSCTMDERQ